ncbi:hypothetical protein COK00_18725 [Bacillus cereus]|nr:hypothetical protein CN399_01295 [Bacillus cereus]PFP62650.1 hypothetical protein COK00_18725 [Bacillus cereus]PFV55188.1 hypothetical protein COL09_22040 [Bacillus cereus]PGK48937.1 hypothetical protein CN909_04115 [Bacillus cereus]
MRSTKNFSFPGEFSIKSICQKSKMISVGTVFQIDYHIFSVGNVIIKCDSTLLLEIYESPPKKRKLS